MRRAPYTECQLYVDGMPSLQVGHYIRTRGGSGYWVTGMRQNKRRPQRRHLRCLRWPVEEIPPDATVHELVWYSRSRRKSRGPA